MLEWLKFWIMKDIAEIVTTFIFVLLLFGFLLIVDKKKGKDREKEDGKQ